ncbi:hypothetical protein TA3x_003559 [Tundrisphaera sp. TA3]|uniref:hypothetical protein n=1 Tax=Tundrisphaera sp. TA3 TaxID=3435775 RepID=UPI003EB91B25
MQFKKRLGLAISAAHIFLVGQVPIANSAQRAGVAGDQSAKSADRTPALKMHRLGAGEPGNDGWYEAKSTEGHFRVSMPFPFNDGTIQLPADPTARSYLINSTSSEGYKFTVMEIETKKGKANSPLKSLPDGIRAKGEAKLSGERYFQHQGHPAVEFQAVGPKQGIYTRVINCSDRLFSLMVEYPAGSEAEVGPLVSGFFESLRIDLKSGEKGK